MTLSERSQATPSRVVPCFRYVRFLTWSLVIFIAAFVPVTSSAQSLGRVNATESNITSYFYYLQPGQATVQIQVLGMVRNPGLYEVRAGTDLDKMVALAGGPVVNVRYDNDVRTVLVRLFRRMPEQREIIYEAPMDNLGSLVAPYPVLVDGDLLSIEVIEKRRFNWRDTFTVAGAVAAVALATERFVRAMD